MTLPNKRNYKSLKHNKVDTHGTSSKTKTRKSIANPPNLKSLQDALDYCNSNLNLLQLHQTDKNKKLQLEQISTSLFATISKDVDTRKIDTYSDKIRVQTQEIERKESYLNRKIKELHFKFRKQIYQYKISSVFKQQLQQLNAVESEEKKSQKSLRNSKPSSLSKKQTAELKLYKKLLYSFQRVKLKKNYVDLCENFCVKAADKDRQLKQTAVVVGEGNQNHYGTKGRTNRKFVTPMERWNTKRFQKRKNLPQASRTILKTWIDRHINNPHPNDSEKMDLAKAANITVEQVCNWFVNARVRYVPQRIQALKSI